MDDIDHKIIELLAMDARRALADIGTHVSLSPSAVNERIRLLRKGGALRRLSVDADPRAMGLPLLAFVFVALAEGQEDAFRSFVAVHRAIAECHHVTGPWSYLIKIHVASLQEIETFLAEMKARRFLARSETMLALSSVVEGVFAPKEQG